MTPDGVTAEGKGNAARIIAEHYRVERELGRGGMATVYLCTDLRDGREVALKLLQPDLANAVTSERFLREVAFVSELDHPRIPRVIESGVEGDLPFYVMTFVKGESLGLRIAREKPMPIAEAVRIAGEGTLVIDEEGVGVYTIDLSSILQSSVFQCGGQPPPEAGANSPTESPGFCFSLTFEDATFDPDGPEAVIQGSATITDSEGCQGECFPGSLNRD